MMEKEVYVKESFQENRTTLGKVLPLDTPYTALIDVSDVCNFKCNYCFRASGSDIKAPGYRNNVLMSWENFTRAIDQLTEFPQQIKRISLSHNGESLCHPMLPEMVSYVKQKGLTGCCEIHSNGTLLTHEKSKQLVEAGLNRIIISLQGMSAEMYKEVCHATIDMDKFYDELAYLYSIKSENLQVNIKIVREALLDGEEELFLKKYGEVADRVFIEQVIPLWGVEDVPEEGGQWVNKYGRKEKWQSCCPLLFYTIGVHPTGEIYPCSHIVPPFKLGNVADTTLKDAWNSMRRKEFMRQILREGRGACNECANCYIPQNTIMTDADRIEEYREEILERLMKK